MKVNAIIVARMNSSRLPGKVLKKILGKPLLEHLVDRVKYSKYVDEIIIATTKSKSDDKIEYFANYKNIRCVRGNEDDVLSRIQEVVNTFDADIFLHLLGDNPLIHSTLIDSVIDFYIKNEFNAVSTSTKEYKYKDENVNIFSNGIRVQLYEPAVLKKCNEIVSDKYDREHSTNHIFSNPKIFNIGFFEAKNTWKFLNKPEIDLAVNTAKDFERISKIFFKHYINDNNFSLNSVAKSL